MSIIRDLAEMSGISSEYTDKVGQIHHTTDEVRKCFLQDMGYACSSEADINNSIRKLDESIWREGLDCVNAFYTDEEDFSVKFCIPESERGGMADFSIEDETGRTIVGNIDLSQLDVVETKIIDSVNYVMLKPVLFTKLNPGYYHLSINHNNRTSYSMLIMALPKCYLVNGLAEEQLKVYGLAIQLYALRSKHNMGIGDFGDLQEIIKLVSAQGGDVVGLNPLGAMFPESHSDVSPYRSLSRSFLNYAYIDLTAVPEYKNSNVVQSLMQTENIKHQLSHLREQDKVDYYGVFKLKTTILKAMYRYFCENHLNEEIGISTRGKTFLHYVNVQGEKLSNICLFESLLEKYSMDGTHNDWRFWPYNYDKIHSFHTKEFRKLNEDNMQFYAYCHWLADIQLAEASKLCKDLGMKVGLYLDSPIGAASSGVEVWENRSVFAENMGIGAPADPMRPRGQSWGFAPYHPQKLRMAYYEPFIHLIRENMRHAQALRIDHAMGLMRLFWVYFMPNNPVVQGAYVYYNIKEMVAILSIESHRAKCMIIGEDLGTVPPGFREYMYEHGLLSNKVFFRQKDKDGSYLAPEKYQYLSLAQASTHDQATAYGYWLSEDINTFKACRLYVNEDQFLSNLKTRSSELSLLVKAFDEHNTFYVPTDKLDAEAKLNGKEVPAHLEYAVNKYVAKTNSAIFLSRIEDIYGQIVMENVPGTVGEYPNWRVKLDIDVEDIASDGRFASMFAMIKQLRK